MWVVLLDSGCPATVIFKEFFHGMGFYRSLQMLTNTPVINVSAKHANLRTTMSRLQSFPDIEDMVSTEKSKQKTQNRIKLFEEFFNVIRYVW